MSTTDISYRRPQLHRFNAAPTVREVIKELSKRPQDAVVVTADHDGINGKGSVLFITEAYEDSDFNVENGTQIVLLIPRR